MAEHDAAIREAVCNALIEVDAEGDVPGFLRKEYQALADAAIAAHIRALEAAGFVVVPIEPTEAMHAASNREWDGRMSARSCGVWQAMLVAARQET